MSTDTSTCKELLFDEISETPEEHLPNLLQIVRIFRESVTLKSAEDSIRQGMQEALAGKTSPVSDLWNGIDAE